MGVETIPNLPNIEVAKDKLRVIGSINFNTVVALRNLGDAIIKTESKLCFDFKDVTHADSSALALLLAWLRLAKQQDKPLSFINLPESLLIMAQAFDIKSFLPLPSSSADLT